MNERNEWTDGAVSIGLMRTVVGPKKKGIRDKEETRSPLRRWNLYEQLHVILFFFFFCRN